MQGHLLERRRGEDRKVLFFKIEHWCRQGTSSRVHSYTDIYVYFVYLAVQNSSIGDLVCLSLGPAPLTIRHYRVTLETCDL